MTCSVQCEYQLPRISAVAADLNVIIFYIIYIIFNHPVVYFSSELPECFHFPSLKDTLPCEKHGGP